MGRLSLACLVVFAANAGLLVLQLVAGRLIAPFVGSSLATWTAVIGMFLLGISLGNWLGGKLADRSARVGTLRLILLLGGLLTCGSFGVIKLIGDGSILRGIDLYPRIALLTAVVCLPPALVLSLLTPMTIKLILPDVTQTGRIVGLIYALGTLGSLIGNFVTGFVLIAYLSVPAIVLGTGGVLIALSLVMLFVPNVESVAIQTRQVDTAFPDAKRPALIPELTMTQACGIVFLCSFCSMALELAASRLLAPRLGVSLYSWTGIIGVVLAGVVCGNYLGGRLADKRPRRETLGTWLFFSGVFSLVVVLLFGLLSQFEGTSFTLPGSQTSLPALKDWPIMIRIVTWAAVLFFAPMLMLGTISPQVTRLAVSDWEHAGRVAGRVYAWSCAGAIGGTFATGWILIGQLGVVRLIFGISLILIALSTWIGRILNRPAELLGNAIVAGAAVVGLLITGHIKGQFDTTAVAERESNYYLIRVTKNTDFVDDEERVVGLNLVLDTLKHSSIKGEYVMKNGQQVFVSDPSDLGYEHEYVQSEFVRCAADRHNTPHVLLIGGGGYTLPRWVERFVPQASMEVVEIDPAVTEMVHDHLDLPRTTKIKSHHMDGRQFVQEKAEKGHYHLVVQDAVNDLSVPYHIMTKEYNDAVHKILADDGVYLLTVIDEYEVGELLPAAIRTMQASFPHVRMLGESAIWEYKSRGVFVIAGSLKPLDLEAMKEALGRQNTEMKTIAMPDELLAEYLAGKANIILTDNYAPVDNLISITYRRR